MPPQYQNNYIWFLENVLKISPKNDERMKKSNTKLLSIKGDKQSDKYIIIHIIKNYQPVSFLPTCGSHLSLPENYLLLTFRSLK